ncbi:recombinase family protein [Akkermansia sp. B2-R-115]|jgi:DNA invertase Pin-like site-specific DNA recombinase|uniref:recombinase family protein n=1 Tax=Akkermansia massiliensis TaxID=2927224 RepID=UPI0020307F40|nr:recombinase family protein [Akkermansia sp. B2-R-115]MCM0685311.1 recombinase family protein [Akkermansia sp. B2-R-115]
MNKKVPKVAILCRVSTEEQDTSRQVSELKALCHEKGWNVVAVVENQESGMKRSLAGLETVKELARKGKIQKVVVSEISRIARRLSVVSKFVEEMEDLKVSIFWQNQGLETLQENGERNGVANIFLAAFAEIARNEREMTVKRIRSGLASAREKGKVLGRPKNSLKSPQQFLSDHRGIVRRLKEKQAIRDIARLERCSFSTIYKVKNVLEEM